jgi:hypothetical protein
MTDEQKFMQKALIGAIETCGEMIADMDGMMGIPSLSASGNVQKGPLTGKRVKLTFEIVKEKDDD